MVGGGGSDRRERPVTEEILAELHEALSEAYPYADQLDLEVDGDYAHVTIHLTSTWRERQSFTWHGPIFGWLLS
jgi:hypothetical protein